MAPDCSTQCVSSCIAVVWHCIALSNRLWRTDKYGKFTLLLKASINYTHQQFTALLMNDSQSPWWAALTWVLSPFTPLDEAEDEQYQQQQHDGAHHADKPALRRKALLHLRHGCTGKRRREVERTESEVFFLYKAETGWKYKSSEKDEEGETWRRKQNLEQKRQSMMNSDRVAVHWNKHK